MGAWIEITGQMMKKKIHIVAPHDGCVDWNYYMHDVLQAPLESHPTMGAWIEILINSSSLIFLTVAPHDGCVDWNNILLHLRRTHKRRTPRWVRGLKFNINVAIHNAMAMSHPTMGAWIEICDGTLTYDDGVRRTPRWVRGLKSVFGVHTATAFWSHPTMGAWIEIHV